MTYDTIVSNMAGELRSALAEKGFCHRIGIPRLINQELLKPTGKPRLANTSFGYQVSMNSHIQVNVERIYHKKLIKYRNHSGELLTTDSH